MRFRITRQDLEPAFKHALSATGSGKAYPILSNILIEATEQGELKLCATDMTIQIEVTTEAEVETPGQTTVPAAKLRDILSSMSAQAQIEFQRNGENMEVKSGKSRFKLRTLPAEQYPAIDTGQPLRKISVSENSLNSMLSVVSHAMAKGDVRAALNGVYLGFESGQLKAVATDGHRLAIDAHEASFEVNDDNAPESVIISREAVQSLQKLLSKSAEEAITVEVGDAHLRVAIDSLVFTAKLVSARYPDYNRVIPSMTEQPVRIERQRLQKALERVRIMASENFRGTKVRFADNQIELTAISGNATDNAHEAIGCELPSDESMEMGFNADYILDALKATQAETLDFHLHGEEHSVLVIPQGEALASQFVLMPIRL